MTGAARHRPARSRFRRALHVAAVTVGAAAVATWSLGPRASSRPPTVRRSRSTVRSDCPTRAPRCSSARARTPRSPTARCMPRRSLVAGAERAGTDDMAYGAPEGAEGLTASSFVLQGEDGAGGRNLGPGLLTGGAAALTGGGLLIRRRFLVREDRHHPSAPPPTRPRSSDRGRAASTLNPAGRPRRSRCRASGVRGAATNRPRRGRVPRASVARAGR